MATQYHLVMVMDLCVERVQQPIADQDRNIYTLGDAVLRACVRPEHMQTPEGPKRVRNCGVLGTNPCVRYVDAFWNNETRLFVNVDGRFDSLDQLSEAELQTAKTLLETELERRRR